MSGPITAADPDRAEANIDAFTRAERMLERRGHTVCNPLDHRKPDWPWEKCMRVDLAHMLTCDAVLMLEGWEHSRGARIEHDLAASIAMAIYDARTMP